MVETRKVEVNLVGSHYYYIPNVFRNHEADEVVELRENGDVFVHVKYFKQECTLLASLGEVNCSTKFGSRPVLLERGVKDFGIYGSTIYFQMRNGARKVFEITDEWAQNALVKAGVVWRNTEDMEEATSL